MRVRRSDYRELVARFRGKREKWTDQEFPPAPQSLGHIPSKSLSYHFKTSHSDASGNASPSSLRTLSYSLMVLTQPISLKATWITVTFCRLLHRWRRRSLQLRGCLAISWRLMWMAFIKSRWGLMEMLRRLWWMITFLWILITGRFSVSPTIMSSGFWLFKKHGPRFMGVMPIYWMDRRLMCTGPWDVVLPKCSTSSKASSQERKCGSSCYNTQEGTTR